MKNAWKSVVTSVVALTLIAAIATAALAGTNALTADTIAANNAAAADAARRTVIEADSFEEATLSTPDGDITYHKAIAGECVGYVFTVQSAGKSAGMVVMAGIDQNGKITGVAVVEESETAGYVDKVTKGGLLTSFVGRTDSEVDTVSQATKTSKGVKKGVEKALGYYRLLKGEE